MGQKIIAAEKENCKQLANMAIKLEFSERQRRFDDKLKRPVVKLAPSSMKVFFGRKRGPAMVAPVINMHRNSIWNMLVEKRDLNS